MPGDNDVTLPNGKDEQVEDLGSAFRQLWGSGQRPRIEDFIPRVPADARPLLLDRLLRIEYELQSQSGETFAVRDYREQFPEFRSVIDSVLAELSTANPASTLDSKGSAGGSTNRVEDQKTLPAEALASGSRGSRSRRTQPATGNSFGDYELLDEIARGGMGVVYRARQRKLNRIVAIKMILSGQFASDDDVQRFYSEAEAAARLDHPGIVPIYEVNEVDGRHFFSMGFVDGESLQHRVARGPLPQREAAQLVRSVAEAVHYAHQHGVVHRDLKPRNILISSDGHPKVTDFGLAKTLEAESGLTVSGQILGTPGYMPPEQATGTLHDVGPQADVYALGAVLYCLLTGRPPFQAASAMETIKMVLETPPVSPRALNPSLDRDLETICLKCLEKQATHRYQTAKELADELDRYLAGEPIRARRIGPIAKSWRWVKRRPMAAALALALLMLAIIVPLSVMYVKQSREESALVDLRRNIDRLLAEPQLTQNYLHEADAMLAALSERRPIVAEEERLRLNERFAAAIDAEIDGPRIDEQAASRILAAIGLLKDRDDPAASGLRNKLERRLRQWQEVFILKLPDANPAEILAGGYEVQEKAIVARFGEGEETARLPTLATSEGIVELEAQFDEGWDRKSKIGLSLKSEGNRGYDFFLTADAVNLPSEESVQVTATPAERLTFQSLRERDGYFTLAVYRNGLLLLNEHLHHGRLPPGRLVLLATCEQAELRMQVGSNPAIVIRDPFPIPRSQSGTFVVHLPKQVGLLELIARRKPKASAESPLERGDELFEQERYELALEQYKQQLLRSEDDEFQQECRYKYASCLMKLGRLDDAAAEFDSLMRSTGERWPPIAGCQLWLIRLRQKRKVEADSVFDYLADHFKFDQIASLIPHDLRQEILGSYRSELESIGMLVRFNPDLVSRVRRFAAIDRFLSLDGRGKELAQMEVARAYHLLGDIPSAVDAAQQIAEGSRNETVVRHYLRLLRLNGEPAYALMEIDSYDQRLAQRGEQSGGLLILERARINAAMQRWQECEKSLERFLHHYRDRGIPDARHFTYYAFMKGMLLERAGMPDAAKAIWRRGYEEMKPEIEHLKGPNTEAMNAVIMGSLCGDLTKAEAQSFFNGMVNRGGDNAIVRQAQTIVGPDLLAVSLMQMWQSKLGRKLAEDFAFERFSLRDRVKVPTVLVATEYFSQSAFQSEMTDDQRQMIYDALLQAYDETVYSGKITISHIAQIILAWKGTSNFLGWGGVAPSLSPGTRAGFAYLMAHRYLRLQNPPQAAQFLDTVLVDAPASSQLVQLATDDKRLLAAKRGMLKLSSNVPEPVQLRIEQGGRQVALVDLQGEQEIEVPAGELHLSLLTSRDDLRLSRSMLPMPPTGRRTVQAQWVWQPDTQRKPLSGLIPHPASAAVNARWQIVFKHPQQEIRGLAWNPASDQFVAAASDGLLRIYDAKSQKVLKVLENAPQWLSDVIWAPSSDLIVACGEDQWIRGWRVSSGQVQFERNDHRSGVTALSWRGDGKQFVSSSHRSDTSALLWNAQGGLVRTFKHAFAPAHHAAMSADGKWIARRGPEPETTIEVIDASSGKAFSLPSDGHRHTRLAFSADSRFLASGSDSNWICLWQTSDWKPAAILKAEGGWLCDLHWSVDGKQLWAGISGREIVEFDLTSNPPREAKRYPAAGLSHFAPSPNGRQLLFAAVNSRQALIDIPTGESVAWGSTNRGLLTIAVRPGSQGEIAIAGHDGVLRLLNAQGRVTLTQPLEKPTHIYQLAWNTDGSLLAGLLNDGQIAIWSPEGNLQGIHAVQAVHHYASLGWTKNNTILVLCGDHKSREVSPSDGTVITTRELKSGGFVVLDRRIARQATSIDGKIYIHDADANSELPLASQDNHRREAHVVAYSPNADRLATRSGNRLVTIWKQDGTIVADLSETEQRATRLAWSPSGDRLAVSTFQGEVQIWGADGTRLGTINGAFLGENSDIAWLNEDRLATVGEDACLRLFDTKALQAESLTVLLPQGQWARFAASGRLLEASGSIDNELLYVIESARGEVELLRPNEFSQRVGLPLVAPTEPSPSEPKAPMVEAPAKDSEQLESRELAVLKDPAILESSGLAASNLDHAMWTHNDDEKSARLYLVARTGETLGRFDLDMVRPFDWEDMSSFRRGETRYLLVGDIGDNRAAREECLLHLVKEPDLKSLSAEPVQVPVEATIAWSYEDGPHDCEALAVDAERNVALLITKELDEACLLYEVPLEVTGKKVVAKKVRELKLPLVTGMDISPDGRRLVVLGGLHAFEFPRSPEESWSDALARVPRRYLLPEAKQPEAIAYRLDGKALLLTSEGERTPLWELMLRE